MIVVVIKDNQRSYTGTSWPEVLIKLHKDQLVPEKTELRYMRAVARRVKMWNGGVVRTDTPEHFFIDLEMQGIVRIGFVH